MTRAANSIIAAMTAAEFGDTVSFQVILRRALAMLRSISAVFALLCQLIASAAAQDAPRSECLAMADASPRATPVSLRRIAAKTDEVAITYAGHSTYYIDTPGGVRIGKQRVMRAMRAVHGDVIG